MRSVSQLLQLIKRPISVQSSLLILLGLAVTIQTFYLLALPISFEGDASIYYRFARWIARFEQHDLRTWQRPPGFPLYLHIFGMTRWESFNGVIAANVIMGVTLPLLVFGTLYPLGNRLAFGAAFVYTISGWPFSYAKLFITEQPYSFFVVLTAFALSRFIVTRKIEYTMISLAAALAALMMRNEGIYIAILAVVVGASFAITRRNLTAFVAVCVSALVMLSTILAWSWVRSSSRWGVGQPELFGSLHNYSGWQLFGRLYYSVGGDAALYQFSRPPENATGRWTPDRRVIFVRAENGPNSAKLAEMMPRELAENPDLANFGVIVTEVMRRADGGANTIEYHKGILETDKFLNAVVKETVVAHPEVLGVIALSALNYFGINPFVAKLWPPPFFTVWTSDLYEAMPYDIGKQASSSLSPRLFESYTASHWPRPQWLVSFDEVERTLQNIVRNALGLVLAVTIWFLPATRHRWLASFVVLAAGTMIAAAAVGFGYNGRYEHMIIPYLIMISAFAIEAAYRVLRHCSSRLALSLRDNASYR